MQLTLANGVGHTDELGLPDGHYKLTWNFDGEHGQAKQKVFWVACKSASPSPGSSSPAASASASAGPSESGTPTVAPTPSGSSGGVVGGAGNTPQPQTSDASSSLPVTGTSLTLLAGVALALIAAGILMRARLGRLFRRS